MSFNRTEDSKEICPRLGLPHQYWPQGNCQYCGELAPPLAALKAEAGNAVQALRKIEAAAIGGYLTPDLCAEIVTSALHDKEEGL